MKSYYKIIFYMASIYAIIFSKKLNHYEFILLLIFIVMNLIKSKYIYRKWLWCLEAIVLYFLVKLNHHHCFLVVMVVIEEVYMKNYYGAAFINVIIFYIDRNMIIPYIVNLVLGISYGVNKREKEHIHKTYKEIYDKERRLNYELQGTKERLIENSRELVYMTEIKERNRIAQEIHDNIGHRIAGISFQLQAILKIMDKDIEKSKKLMNSSVDALNEALEIVRNAVYNIKPDKNLDMRYIKTIIDEFVFCPVDFKFIGDINFISTNHFNVIVKNLKESLTNVCKYSNCKEVKVELTASSNMIRLMVKDDGVGAVNIKEGLGIKGMRERVENMGGSFYIDFANGTTMVTILKVRD